MMRCTCLRVLARSLALALALSLSLSPPLSVFLASLCHSPSVHICVFMCIELLSIYPSIYVYVHMYMYVHTYIYICILYIYVCIHMYILYLSIVKVGLSECKNVDVYACACTGCVCSLGRRKEGWREGGMQICMHVLST